MMAPGSESSRRVLLKLSGEVLAGKAGHGLDPATLEGLARSIVKLRDTGCQVGIVIGGGNYVRGKEIGFLDRVTGDQMGMLATLVNALALRDTLETAGARAAILSAIPVSGIVDMFDPRRASALLSTWTVLIYAGGTGNPYLTTDTAAALRAVQTRCTLLLKGTKVDGVYTADPETDPDAVRIPRAGYDEVLRKGLKVMDAAAVAICRDAALPIRVFDILDPENIVRVMDDPSIGSIVAGGGE